MYKANEVEFTDLPGNRPVKVNDPVDLTKYRRGYTNPDLLRLYENTPVPFDATDGDHIVEFEPNNNTPQFELAPREYKLYISGLNSYRLTQFHNHDEDSVFWERP